MGSSTANVFSFMASILKNKALSPPNTRRWLKPNTFTSTWSASVGSPCEIYRVDNLASDGRIIDLYTKGGTLSGYQSGMVMIPHTGLTKVKDVTCITWHMLNRFIYKELAMDHFEFRSTEVLTVHGTYSISAQLCIPADGKKSDVLQIATHGFGFDQRYWDPELKPEEYSHVDAALAKGYSILTYDRLGTGKSSKADGYNEVQLGLQITGKRPQKAFYDYKPEKVVHIGHSFGSATTSGLLSLHGNLSDGAILTGFLPNNQRGKIFLKKGSFEVEALEYAEKTKQTGTVGELSSGMIGQPVTEFKGPPPVLHRRE
ncbi:alpha beta-Hydrolase [Fusarium agapanthi]|uniref:Alpha beta-Hydrolase n=1 Tax=Fusarium agapanthi TaxID=1803897 RepID=A0A9P5B8X3_9HYPO|nr:alpha beta-Hydrolase [Fusarium agapanthi]